MRHSTSLFYLTLVPGVSFIIFFLLHTVALFPIFFDFFVHMCVGAARIMSIAPGTLLVSILLILITCVIVIFLCSKLVSFFITFWRVQHLPIISQTQNLGCLEALKRTYSKIKIHDSSQPTAFCYFDTIFLSSALLAELDRRELEAVFLHEYVHVRNYDSIKSWLLELVDRSIILPVFRYFLAEFKLAIEIEADEFVIFTQGTNLYLKKALLKVIAYPNSHVHNFASSHLETRIRAIQDTKTIKREKNIALLSAIIVSFFLVVAFLDHTKMVMAVSETIVHEEAGQCSNGTRRESSSSLHVQSSILWLN